VSAAGNVTSGELGGASITHPAVGVHCFEYLYGDVIVASADVASPNVVASDAVNPASAPCGAHTTVQVRVFTISGTPTNGALDVVG
jgi:hypothetical protein